MEFIRLKSGTYVALRAITCMTKQGDQYRLVAGSNTTLIIDADEFRDIEGKLMGGISGFITYDVARK